MLFTLNDCIVIYNKINPFVSSAASLNYKVTKTPKEFSHFVFKFDPVTGCPMFQTLTSIIHFLDSPLFV